MLKFLQVFTVIFNCLMDNLQPEFIVRLFEDDFRYVYKC